MTAHPLSGRSIAFDLDGTLVDTAPDLVRALNASVEADKLPPVETRDVRAMVGRGARALIRRAYERAERPLDDTVLEARLDTFLTAYRRDIAVDSQPFEGVEALLAALSDAGARLSVCTNKPQALAEALLDELGLLKRFERIVGSDAVPAKKPDAGHLMAAFGGAANGRGVLVGDSEPDVMAAQNAGALSLLFEGGYSEKPAHTLGADRLFSRFDDVEAILIEALGNKARPD